MASDNRDDLVGRVGTGDFGDKTRGTDDVEGGDAKEALGVVDALGFENFGADWDGGVDLSKDGLVRKMILRAGKRQFPLTGFEMTRTLAFGAASAVAFARSRTIEALVLNRSILCQHA